MLARQDIKALEARLREISVNTNSYEELALRLDESGIPSEGIYVLSELYGANLKANRRGMMDHGLLSRKKDNWSFELLGHFLDGTKQYAIIKEIYESHPPQGACLRYAVAENYRGLIDSFNKCREFPLVC